MSDHVQEQRRERIAKRLESKGFDVSLLYYSDTFNEITGESSNPVVTTITVGAIWAGEQSLMLAAERSFGMALPQPPVVGDQIDIDGDCYRIEDVKPCRPGGVDLYYTLTLAP